MPKPIEVKPLENYRIQVEFSDGVEGIVDLSDLVGKGVFSAWLDERKKSTLEPAARSPGVRRSICAPMRFI